MKTPKQPLWKLLVERGFGKDRHQAEASVLAGEILVDEEPAGKSGVPIPIDSEIRERKQLRRFASRGGEKLSGAIEIFGISLEDRVVLDAGASTGGFTDCLLQCGVRKVYAVDVGFGQLKGRLRNDPRVVNMERRNISSIERNELSPAPTLITLDLSYLSLERAVPIAGRLIATGGEIICLVKPLFETRDNAIRRRGIISSPDTYSELLMELGCGFVDRGFEPIALAKSVIKGSRGTHEFFFHLKRDDESDYPKKRVRELIEALRY